MNKCNYIIVLFGFIWQYSLGQEIYLPTEHPIYTGYPLHAPCVADFDGDGMDELAVTVFHKAGSTQFFDVMPNGELIRTQLINSGDKYEKPIAADMDADGDLDLICITWTNKIVWHENEGNGQFSSIQNIIYQGHSSSLEIIDMDNDGDIDFIFLTPSSFVFLLNDGGDFIINQTFEDKDYLAPFVVDFDVDGDLDVLSFDEDNNTYFFENENGIFSEVQLNTPEDSNLYSITAGDIDDDGDMDLGFLSYNTFYLAFNTGDDVDFSDTLTMTYSTTANVSLEKRISFFDINDDDNLDVVINGAYPTDGIVWFKNTMATFIPQYENTTLFNYIDHFLPMEIDGDSEKEAVVINLANSTASIFDFDQLQNQLIKLNSFQSLTYKIQQTIVADIDVDGDSDVVSFNGNNKIIWHETGILEEDAAVHEISSNRQSLHNSYSIYGENVIGDVNGDGYPDIIAPDDTYPRKTYLYLNQPTTDDFSDTIRLISRAAENSILFDADADGDLDFGFSNTTTDGYFLAENIDGAGTFATPIVINEQKKRPNSPAEAGDIDNDGDLDLVLYAIPEDDIFIRRLIVLENQGAFNFIENAILLDSLSVNGRHDVLLKDMNNDGYIDIIYKKLSHGSSTSILHIGIIYNIDGTGNYSSPNIITNEAAGVFSDFEKLNIEDIDNDGDLDICIFAYKWYENLDNSGEFLSKELTTPPWYGRLRGMVDMDMDGDSDFLFDNKYSLIWTENIATHKYWLDGHLTADTVENCMFDTNEFPFENWKIIADNETYSLSGLTDSLGYYHIPIDTGEWTINAIPKSDFWTPCFQDSLIFMPSVGDTINTDFFMQPNGDCAYIDWTTTGTRLRACQSNTFSLNLCNYGVQTGEDIIIEVILDSLLYFESASLPFTVNADSSYFFDIGSLEINECTSLTIDAFLDCDSASLFLLQCVEFKIHPEEICVPESSIWDEAIIQTNGECVGDSIYFTIENIGNGNMVTAGEFRIEIINDDIVMLLVTDSFQLNTGQQLHLEYPRQGMGMRLSADQTFDNPFNAESSVVVPNCEDIANNIIVEWMPNNNGNPFTNLICNAVFGSYDPNDKAAIPQGVGEEHIIEKDWELDYTIRFQNTGNDTAFLVVLRDTLDENLDLATLNVRGGSHPFTYELNAGRELKITFENILLPDSTTNLMESQGFMTYSITPNADIPTSTIIENTAGIYFDFNPPIITNTVTHKIRRPVVSSSEHLIVCQDEIFQNDTILREEIMLVDYDSIHFTHIQVIPSTESLVTTAVASGTIFEGILIENDTVFTQVYEAENGCDSLVNFEISILINTTSKLFENIEIFPNPVTENIIILNNKGIKAQHWELINVTGKKVWKGDFPDGKTFKELDMSTFPAGIYWLEVRAANEFGVWKVVKQ